ncbi:MAG TPA: D-glucuronyl C5-epimerase family protein, partial [Solirubrobacteraceae bacterium]|nr:D-glucuronyl C5-epimerase family protein [Solirubrobacteraceae bacterium]
STRARRALLSRLPRILVEDAMRSTRRLALRGALRVGRLEAALSGVRASVAVARADRPLPPAGARVRLPGDAAVYSHRPPFGMQVHPLGTAGKVNALAATCTPAARRRGWRCRRRTLAAAADRLVQIGVPAGPTLRFEYLFAFGGGRPGWVSAMTQATGAQALARASAITKQRRYAVAAREAYRALTRDAPRGAAVRDESGLVRQLAMYSFRPGLRVLNGEEQALIGVADYARITRDRDAARLARRAARALAARLPGFDTGAWTLYSLNGAEADMNYHTLAARFARGMCRRALARGFCPAAARFTRYTTEAPRLWLTVPARARAPRRVTIALGASKQSAARVSVRDRTGRVLLDRRLVLGRGGARLLLPVRRAGHLTVALDARAINGRGARRTATVTVTPPPPKPKPKPNKTPKKQAAAKDSTRAERLDQGSAKRTKPGS